MAIEQKKIKDPTEAALSAIEHALNIDESASAGSRNEPRLPDIEAHDFTSPRSADPFENEDFSPSRPSYLSPDPTAVANDDRQSVGMMLQALQARPSRRAYMFAFLASAMWLGALGFLGYSQGVTTIESLLTAFEPAQLAIGGFVLLAPVLLFFIAAMLAVRSQEIKLVARAVGEVAIRLAQPETFSTDAVLSVSQAVRREVAAVGDGVERALARAGELETLVRSEISTLERAYSDNEIRIRSLIDELVVQREAVVTNAERVRAAINGSHQTLTRDLDGAAQRVVEAVNGAGERVSDSLDQRGEQITQALGRAGERVIEDMAARGVDLVDRLTGASDEIKSGIAQVGTTITSTLEGKAQDITGAFERTGDVLTRHLQDGASQVTRTLAETGRGVIDALAQQGNDVRAAFEQTALGLEESFAQRGSEITSKLTSTGTAITEDISSRASEMREQIAIAGSTIAHDLAQSGTTLREQLLTTTNEIVETLADRGNNLRQQLASTGSEVVDEIVVRGSEFRERLATVGADVSHEIVLRGQEVRDGLQNAIRLADDAIGTRVEDLTARLESASQRVNEAVSVQGSALEESLSQAGNSIAALIETRVGEFQLAYETRGREFAEALAQESDSAHTRMAGTGKEIVLAIATQGARVKEALERMADTLTTTVDERGRSVEENLKTRLEAFEDVTNRGGIVADRISSQVGLLTDTISGRLEEMDRLIVVQGSTLVQNLGDRTREATQSIETQISTLEDLASRRSTEITSNFASLVGRIDHTLGARADALNEALVVRTGEMARVMAEGGRDAAEALQAKADEVSQIVAVKTSGMAETLASKAEEINQILATRAEAIGKSVGNRIEFVDRVLSERASEIANTLGSRISEIEDTLASRASEINGLLGGRAEEIASTLDERVTAFEERVVKRLEGFGSNLDEKGRAVYNALGERISEIDDLLENRGGSLLNGLAERNEAISREVTTISDTTLRILEDRSTQMLDLIRHRTADLTSHYTQSTESLRVAIDEGAARAVSTLSGTNERLRSELGSVLDRLQDASRLLQQVVVSATGNLGSVEGGLAEKIQQIENLLGEIASQTNRASDHVADQVDALRVVSTGAIHQATELAYTIEERGRALADGTREQLSAITEATTALENVESRLASALSERQESLIDLLPRINERSQELENVTRSFTHLVEKSLQAAETRARQIGAVLADSAEATTRAIDEQFERIRNSTGLEGERTAETLRHAYEQVAGEMSGALGGATTRFHEAVNEMRRMTTQIQNELDSTRAELRRGIVELPQETQETAANMRRVVAEQIKALNELSALVSRSNRSVDVAQASQGRKVVEGLAPMAPAVATAPARTIEPIVARTAEPTSPMASQQRHVTEKTPSRRAEPQTSLEGKGGWLSDLLNRASREDEIQETNTAKKERSRVNTLESLDSISADIARMIDHEAAIELWDRYKRGEGSVFSRRLYTAQGQQTFDEVRRKYRSDVEFRQTVDRYVDEFERLLAEVSRDDRDSILAKTYLISETGKVYTMLAHASGRFD